MDYGTTFSADWLDDLGALREGAARLDEAGVDFVGHGGHVATFRPGRYERPVGTYGVAFRDPIVLYASLAATTKRLRFRSGILILPMLPTVYVAKQAAELALASGGRFELGVGISWNEAEYRAMGQDLSVRGRRFEEQLAVLKALWSEPFVTFSGRFHDLDEIGLGQLPAAPIPIWVGCGDSDRVLSRVARLGDGWMPTGVPAPERIAALQRFAAEVGREGQVGVTARVNAQPDAPDAAAGEAKTLVESGATALSVSPPPGSNPTDGIDAVIATVAHLRQALGS
ncbi:MAG: TIGR03619 family F420-dependent LLM class oxidoreductase [Acidimicrobiaceae bacterium]|nr:TIGR03619 family F420-dependent LLM class oxidoreductase [Acidimicrobiaceae bacterium]